MSGRTGRNSATQAQPERVMLVGVMLDKDDTGSNAARLNGFQTALAEAVELVKAAGGDSVRVETAKRDRPHTALFVGTGKAWSCRKQLPQTALIWSYSTTNLLPRRNAIWKNPPMPRIGQSGADSGDFRPPRPHAGRQAASRVGAIEPFGGTLDTRLRTFAKPARRYRHESTGRNQTGNRPPINRPSDQRLEKQLANLKNSAPCAASPASRAESKRLRWSAIPMSANPACSTG